MNESIFTKISKKLDFLNPVVAWLKKHPFIPFIVVISAYAIQNILSILIPLFA